MVELASRKAASTTELVRILQWNRFPPRPHLPYNSLRLLTTAIYDQSEWIATFASKKLIAGLAHHARRPACPSPFGDIAS